MTEIMQIANWIGFVLGLLLLITYLPIKRRGKSPRGKVSEAGECMGFDILREDGQQKIVSCNEPLTEGSVHRVIADLSDEELKGEGVGFGPGSGTSVSRDTCDKHCLGGCNRGCELKKSPQGLATPSPEQVFDRTV